MYADVIWDLKIYVSEHKVYQNYQQNIEGNTSSSFRMWKCENFPRSLAYSEIFLNVSVFQYNAVYSAIP